MMTDQKKVTQRKPLMEMVDLGTLYVLTANGVPSKGCGCTPPTRVQKTNS